MQEVKKGFLFKSALLSVSLLIYGAGAVATAIPLMLQSFANVPRTTIEMLITLPSIITVIFVALSNFFVRWWGDKITVMIGVVGLAFFGALPILTPNLTLVVISRLFLGASIGLFNSLSFSIVGKFFAGPELAKMMGYQTATGSVGNFIMVLIVSALISSGWQATFLVYLFAVPIAILFWLVIPSRKKEGPYLAKQEDRAEALTDQPVKKEKAVLTGLTIAFFAIVFIYYFAWPTPPLNLGSIVLTKGYGNLQEATLAISLLSLASMFGGAMFARHFKWLGRMVLPLGMTISGISFIIMATSNNMMITTIFSMLAGYMAGGSNPYIYMRVNEAAKNNASAVLGQSLLVGGASVAYFLMPLFWGFLNGSLKSSQSQVSVVVILGAGILLIGIAAVIFVSMLFSKNPHPRQKTAVDNNSKPAAQE